MRNLHQLVETVQKNCHITDARYARDMTLCTYLLEMRQYYRWENELPYSLSLPKDDLGAWLTEREQLWSALETDSFAPLPLAPEPLDPFDSEQANRALIPEGYVYSAGYGRFRKPHFFLGSLLKRETREGFTVLISGCEYARDLIAPPAVSQSGVIYLRRESVRRFLWEKFEEWQWRKTNDNLSRAFACYDFERDTDAALEQMTDIEGEAMILHEVGEGLAGRAFGPRWGELIEALPGKKLEILARSVRDHLADCLYTLPRLIERSADCSIYFYFANLDGIRKALFPQLGEAYAQWLESRDAGALHEVIAAGRTHWHEAGLDLLERVVEKGETLHYDESLQRYRL